MLEDDFNKQIKTFIELSHQIGDTWQILDIENTSYLTKSTTVALTLLKKSIDIPADPISIDISETDTNILEEDLQECTQSVAEAEVLKTACKFEYHVVFSPSYQVPVLYFNVYKPCGSLLGLDELWSAIPKHYQERLQQERWSFCTQQEHPLLGRPFFQLHPCHTAALLGQVNPPADRYLLTWLTSVAPVVHLDIPLAYAALLTQPGEK